jgi:hypothetical protein
VTHEHAERIAARFIRFLETGSAPEGLFAPHVFCDFSTPCWRQQAEGPSAVIALRKTGHPRPGKVPRFRCDPTPGGFVLELEEEWVEGGQSWYCRELLRADTEGDAVTAVSVYCTGDWDESRRAEHARAVRLLRP